MPLTTRCRHCGRLFPVYATELKANRGRVPCPQCGKRFDAVAGLIDEHVPTTDDRGGRLRHPAHRTSAVPLATQVPGLEPPERLPSRQGHRRGRGRVWLGALAVFVLSLGLAAQAAWWGRGELLRRPQVHAALTKLCPSLGCEVPLPRLPGTIEILQSSLTADPKRPEALRLQLDLVSRAEVPQRAPVLQLELYDPAGSLLAARRFEPPEYLVGDATPGDLSLSPEHAVRVALDMAVQGAASGTRPTGFRIRLL